MAFQALSELKTLLGVSGSTDDTLLAQLQTTAEATIEAHCDRAFTGGTFTEYFPGGSYVLFLRNYPVVTVTEIRVDVDRVFGSGSLQDASGYALLAERGVIQSRRGRFVFGAAPNQYQGAVKVIYTTATGAVPVPVTHAAAELVSHWYRQTKTHGEQNQMNVLQQTNGTVITQFPWGQSGGFKLPLGVMQLLEPYRTVGV